MSGRNVRLTVIVGPKLLAEWTSARLTMAHIPTNEYSLPYALGAVLELAMHEDIERWKAQSTTNKPAAAARQATQEEQ